MVVVVTMNSVVQRHSQREDLAVEFEYNLGKFLNNGVVLGNEVKNKFMKELASWEQEKLEKEVKQVIDVLLTLSIKVYNVVNAIEVFIRFLIDGYEHTKTTNVLECVLEALATRTTSKEKTVRLRGIEITG